MSSGVRNIRQGNVVLLARGRGDDEGAAGARVIVAAPADDAAASAVPVTVQAASTAMRVYAFIGSPGNGVAETAALSPAALAVPLTPSCRHLAGVSAPSAHASTSLRPAMAYDRLLRRSVLGAGPYVPGASAQETKARLGREDLIRLNWNENLFGPLPGVVEETAAALDAAWAYPEEAYDQLRHDVAAWAGARPDEVIPGHGIQALTLALAAAFIEAGDRVIVPRPTYGLYAQVCATAGADVRRVPTDPALRLDLEAIAGAATDARAKLVWVCDPNNPTGRRLDPSDWAAFLEALPGDCAVVADEAYIDYIAPERRIDRLADIRAGRPVIVMRTFSKIFGLAGLRLGYLLIDPALATHVNAVQEPFNVNVAALAAGVASLRRTDRLPARREQVTRARRALCDPLRTTAIRAIPSDANFVLLDLGGADDVEVCEALAHQGILVRAGSEFGLPGHARVTTGEEALMDDVARRLVGLVGGAGGAGGA